MIDKQLLLLYKLVCNEKGTPVSCAYVEPGKVDIDVAVPVYGSTVTTTCSLGTDEYPHCACLPSKYQHYCYCYDDYDDDYYGWEWDYDHLQTEWDHKLGKRPSENWDDQ